MDYNRKQKLFYLLVGALILALIIFGVWWWLSGRPNTNITNQPIGNPAGDQNSPGNQVAPGGSTVSSAPIGQRNALSLARLFTERFGTFSSQGQFEGIRELEQVSTPTMSEWLTNQYIPQLRSKYPADKYVGQTTNILSAQLTNQSDSQAEARIRTQQLLTVGSAAPTVTSPILILKLTKSGEVWLVDNARWEQQ
jgi:hypothetical protein